MYMEWWGWLVFGVLYVLGIIAYGQARKYRERAIVCDAIASVLSRCPKAYDDGAVWISKQLAYELEMKGWQKFGFDE